MNKAMKALVATAAVVGLSGGAVAIAAIPDSNGVIHGCINNISKGIRVVDYPTETCKYAETPLNWNQSGPQGLPGVTGSPGPQGVPGPKGDAGAISSTYVIDSDPIEVLPGYSAGGTAYCRPGDLVISGGGIDPGGTGYLSSSYAHVTFGYSNPDGWGVVYKNPYTYSLYVSVQVVCVDITA